MDAHACACLSFSEFSDNADRQDRLESVQGDCAGDFARQDRLSRQSAPEKRQELSDNCFRLELWLGCLMLAMFEVLTRPDMFRSVTGARDMTTSTLISETLKIGYPRYIIFGIFGVIFAISVCFFHFFVFFGCIFFAFFMCLTMKIFGVHFSSIFCGFFFIFCVHFLHFLLPPIVQVDILDIAIISVIPDMVKAIISGITNCGTAVACMSRASSSTGI
jgi:hypothetical protein